MHNSILTDLRNDGAALFERAIPSETIARVRDCAAIRFNGSSEGFRFTPFSWSMVIAAVPEHEELLSRLASLQPLFDQALAVSARCDLNESWVRKRFAPAHAPRYYQPNRWHQDGGLGADFHSASPPRLRRMLTCWIPLDPSGVDRPGLELIRSRLNVLLPYTELDDQLLRRRFSSELFWAPELRPGDVLVFLDGCLHRTHVRPEMQNDRLSVEYRFFPQSDPPATMEA